MKNLVIFEQDVTRYLYSTPYTQLDNQISLIKYTLIIYFFYFDFFLNAYYLRKRYFGHSMRNSSLQRMGSEDSERNKLRDGHTHIRKTQNELDQSSCIRADIIANIP